MKGWTLLKKFPFHLCALARRSKSLLGEMENRSFEACGVV